MNRAYRMKCRHFRMHKISHFYFPCSLFSGGLLKQEIHGEMWREDSDDNYRTGLEKSQSIYGIRGWWLRKKGNWQTYPRKVFCLGRNWRLVQRKQQRKKGKVEDGPERGQGEGCPQRLPAAPTAWLSGRLWETQYLSSRAFLWTEVRIHLSWLLEKRQYLTTTKEVNNNRQGTRYKTKEM